jgi:hypothetical protein
MLIKYKGINPPRGDSAIGSTHIQCFEKIMIEIMLFEVGDGSNCVTAGMAMTVG